MDLKKYQIGITIIALVMALKSSYDLFHFFIVERDSLPLIGISLCNLIIAIGLLFKIKITYKIFSVYANLMLILSVGFYTIFIFSGNNFYFFDTAHIALLIALLFWIIASFIIRKVLIKGDEKSIGSD